MADASLSIKRALISVADKHGVAEFAAHLAQAGVELVSTGGSAQTLAAAGLEVTEVSELTGFPEMMGGRLKTLHPKIHGGILGRRGIDEAVMNRHQIAPIDLVVVNLYPFEATVARDDCSPAEAIENIDIGGPALLRAAAKNHQSVVVVVDPADYAQVASQIASGGLSMDCRKTLAAKAFALTAAYDSAIARYLGHNDSALPQVFTCAYGKRQSLRYGENPHQQGALYTSPTAPPGSLAAATLIQGKALSYNNLADADAAVACVDEFPETACVIVKHANPCGVAIGETLYEAYQRAFAGDPVAAFGGIIACNREVDQDSAEAMIDGQFLELLIAPKISPAASQVLARKPNVRVMEYGQQRLASESWQIRSVNGGLLVQSTDAGTVSAAELKVVSKRSVQPQQVKDLMFAWRVAKYVKSNAIVYAREGATIGIGAGQMSRVTAVRLAAMKAAEAQLEVSRSVMASDAFFPFRDGIDAAAEAGIAAVIQPGGSRRDAEVIAAADEHDMVMVFTGRRHFRHA